MELASWAQSAVANFIKHLWEPVFEYHFTSRAFSEQFFHWETALRSMVKNLMRGIRTHEMRATKTEFHFSTRDISMFYLQLANMEQVIYRIYLHFTRT